MIKRYSRKELTDIWSEENKYKIWLDVEVAAAEAMEKLGQIPKGVASVVRKKTKINVSRIHKIESEVKHDVIAFLTSVTEKAGIKARYLHQGMTSSDVLDTSFNIQMVQSGKIILKDLDQILKVLKKQAKKYKFTPGMGRSHGIHAEPVTFGLKLASFYEEFKRNRKRLVDAIDEVSTCAISGAVGTFANIAPFIEEYVCNQLCLYPEPIATQVIPRDRHAAFFATLGVIASSVENIATEIRHMQRTEVLEAEEFFSKGQKGSSAMPHKRNPVLNENLTGLSRLVRMAVIPAMENVTLWHERDISHSSVERNIGPDATVTLDFALARLTSVIKNLVVYPENMMKNMNKFQGLIMSQRVLLALTQAGLSREDAYRLVQRNAMKVWEEGKDFKTELKNDPEVTKVLANEEIDEQFDLEYHTKHVDTIFQRVFSD